MANGSSHEGPARADRIREELRKNRELRLEALAPGSQPYREEMDSVSEVTANASGLHARGIPKEAWRWIGIGIALFIASAGVALVVALL